MTVIAVDKLETENITQNFTIKEDIERLTLRYLRTYLYISNRSSIATNAVFTLSIKSGTATLGESSISMADINNIITKEYAHGYFKFEFLPAIVLRPGEYMAELSFTDYTYTSSNYIGWVKEVENLIVDNYGETATKGADNPHGIRIYGFENYRG
jgi:hypothetical protein